MSAGNTLFDQIGILWEKTTIVNTKTKPESIYMSCRFISLSPDGILPANECNKYSRAPEWSKLPFLQTCLPKQKRPWSKYPKKVAENKLPPRKEKGLEQVCRKFNVDRFHGLQIMALLENQGFIIEGN